MAVLSTADNARGSLPTHSASLHCLSDDSLLAIFHQLPVFDLVRAHCICRRWKVLAPIVCRRRQALLLTDRAQPMTKVISNFMGPFFYLRQALVKDDGSPVLRLLTDEEYALCVKPHSKDDELALSQAQFWSHLPEFLPNVRRLYVSLNGTTPILELLARLITKWVPNLVLFHLHYWNCDSLVNDDKKTICAISSILERINSMGRLRHLSFVWHPNPSFSSFLTLYLPVISQLQSLDLEFNYQDTLSDKQLLEQLSEASALRRVTIRNNLEVGALLEVPSPIARLFTDLWLFRTIKKHSVDEFGQLLGHYQYSCVTHLSFATEILPHRLAPLLGQLPHLTFLSLRYHCGKEPPDEELPLPEHLPEHLRLPSVKGLLLFVDLRRHSHLERLYLGTLFPSVQVASINSCASICRDCKFNYFWDHSAFDSKVVAQCDQMFQAYLHFSFPQLRKVFRAERIALESWALYKEATI